MRIVFVIVLIFTPALHAGSRTSSANGTVSFEPIGDQKNIPECYRLEPHQFDFELVLKRDLPANGIAIYELRFPSPVKSPCPENNTVYAEYYRPAGRGPFPCVIVLDITAGDQSLSRAIAKNFAKNDIAALFVQMAYYGPRRPNGSKERLLSADIEHTMAAVRQTVLDLRRAVAWMESRPEIGKKNLGIMGTSLGSFVAALTAEMEPKLGRVAVVLGGADFVDGYSDHPRAAAYFKLMESIGITRDLMKAVIAPIDPITCAANLKDRKLLIVAAKKDEVVPPRMAENLWNATGRQRIIWLNAGHFTAALYLMSGLSEIVDHFKREGQRASDGTTR